MEPAPTSTSLRFGNRLVLAFSSWVGLGYLPKAPGTWGTLGALPLWWLLRDLPVWGFVAFTVLFTLFSIWISALAESVYRAHDVQKIVIDEVAGLLVTAIAVPWNVKTAVAVFVLFRLFDMAKPGPIRWVDDHVKGGSGVVLDDIAAGIVGCAVVHGLQFATGWLW